MLRRSTFLHRLASVALGVMSLRLAKAAPPATAGVAAASSGADAKQLFGALSFHEKVPAAARQEFLSSLTYTDGHLAHMNFKALRPVLSVEELNLVFATVGADMEKLDSLKDKFCYSSSNGRFCADNTDSYCDPRYCQS